MAYYKVIFRTTRGTRIIDGVRADSKPSAERIAESMLARRDKGMRLGMVVLDATVLAAGEC